MWLERLLTSRVTQAIELSARFAEQRNNVLMENVANINTPDFHARSLDQPVFEKALRDAFKNADRRGEQRLNLRGNAQVSTDAAGDLRVKPQVEPASNVLFHDGTNAQLESLMADVQSNALRYNLATTMLRGRFDGLLTAIRGRVQ